MNNATTEFPGVPLHPVDARFGGRDLYLPLQIETTLSQEGRQQFRSGSWFWHEWDHSVADRATMLGWLDSAKQLEANLLINAGPMASGRLRPEDDRALRSLRG